MSGRTRTVAGVSTSTTPDRKHGGLRLLGVGAAACVACCAGPVLAFLGGLGVAGVASAVLVGATGLLVPAAAIVAIVVVRRGARCAVPDNTGPVRVAAPARPAADRP
jgi:hypothetical protein